MKKSLVLSLIGLGAVGVAQAQEVGRVISTTPVIQQYAVPRQVCSNQQVAVEQPKTGAGGVMGAIAGGAVGNQIGHGGGRAAATVLGLVGGAILGDRIEGPGATQVQNVQNCTTQTFYENRATSYNVVYEYAGKQYTVQLPYDPGPTIKLQVSPVGASMQQPQQPQPAYGTPMTSAEPAQVVTNTVVVPAAYPYYAAPYGYYRPYYYPPVSLSIGYVHHGGHWR
jgi:uncharacterized protein YcfJ